MIVFYESVNYIDSVLLEEPDRKIVLDPFCSEVPEGYELADASIRDIIDVWCRHFQWLVENELPPVNYKIVTEYPEVYTNHGLEEYLEIYKPPLTDSE